MRKWITNWQKPEYSFWNIIWVAVWVGVTAELVYSHYGTMQKLGFYSAMLVILIYLPLRKIN